MEKLIIFIEKVLASNFGDSLYKYTYLYNELFISIYNKEKELILFGVSYKANKLLINKYSGEDSSYGRLLLAIFKKYEKIFLKLLEDSNKNLFRIGDESEFVNVYDKKELNFNDIKTKLSFNFLDDYSYRRKIQNEFNFEDRSILDIYHSDFECSKCHGPKETFSSFPNFGDLHDHKYFDNQYSHKKRSFLMTNINDYESITMGGNEKINEILSNKKLLDKYDTISINKTCISVIMGDDIMSIYKYNKVDPKKIFYTDQNTDSPYRTVINYLKSIGMKSGKKNNKVLFFGLNKNRNTYEMIQFLKNHFGIEVGNALLPNIDKKDLEQIVSYKLAVFFSGRESKAQNIFKLYPIDSVESIVPYGLTKIYELYKDILEKYNQNDDIEKLKNIIETSKKDNKAFFKKAKKYEIGFILNDFHIKHFLNNNFRGVPIITLLNDMGFKLNFFIFNNNEKYRGDLDKFNLENDKDSVHNFHTIISSEKKDLDMYIKDKKIQLYYSEISNDKRITDFDKEQFSIKDLEYGLNGFYRSFQILIKKCEKVDYLNNL